MYVLYGDLSVEKNVEKLVKTHYDDSKLEIRDVEMVCTEDQSQKLKLIWFLWKRTHESESFFNSGNVRVWSSINSDGSATQKML